MARKDNVTVSVAKIRSREGGGVIFKAVDVNDPERTFNVIVPYNRNPWPPDAGETWHIEGEWKWHHEWKDQLHASNMWQVEPEGQFVVDYLTKSRAFRGTGVGEEKIKDLWKAFQEELCDLLDAGDVDRLSQVVVRERAEKLVARWQQNKILSSVVSWLQKHRIDPRIATKVLLLWKDETIAKLEEDPYRLVAFDKSLKGWYRIDAIGRALGFADNDSRRLLGAVEHALYARHDKGHTRSDRSDIIPLIRVRLGSTVKPDEALKVACRAEMGRPPKVLGDDTTGYQHCGVAWLEQQVSGRIRSIIVGEAPWQRTLQPSVVLDENLIREVIAKQEKNIKGLFTDAQKQAVHMVARLPIVCLRGGPGVGKTATLSAIRQVMEASGVPIYQMALAGRAAQRVRQATAGPATTIEGFIHAAVRDRAEIPANAVFVIDECSMLDLATVARLLRRVPDGGRIVFVGDPYQLPPISFGLFYHALCDQLPPEYVVELTQVFRQDEASGIIEIARDVRDGIVPDRHVLSYDPSRRGVHFYPCHVGEMQDALKHVFTDLGGDPLETQILGVTKNGMAGVNLTNAMLQYFRSKGKDCLEGDGYRYFTGDPVIHLVNDYEQDLFNGSLGMIKGFDTREDGRWLNIQWDDGRVLRMHEGGVSDIGLAYAITVHKAQGSQFRKVIIPLRKSRLLDRTMVYTAMTRCVDQVVFVGDWDAFEMAVRAAPRAMLRKTGIMF